MTREELHQQVWSQPMRTLAASIGISDVALAKRCRVANVPVPPRGWWARKDAGKAVRIVPLPPLPFAMANYFPAFEGTSKAPDAAGGGEPELSDPPAFRDLAKVQDELRAAVRGIKAPADLAAPHPIVARLLKQDEARPPATGPYPSYNSRKFGTPIQQRRLRLLSCLLTELQRLGCKVSGSTHAGERFSAKIGEGWIYFLLGVEGGPSASYFQGGPQRSRGLAREQLRFDIVDHDERTAPKRTWREDKEPLDKTVSEIIQGLFLQVEDDRRKWALQTHQWRCEDHARKLRDARLAAEKSESDRIAREAAAAAARIGALVEGAEALERASRIRRYAAAVRAAYLERVETTPPDGLERWVAWALAEADAIDPIISQRFAADLDFQNV